MSIPSGESKALVRRELGRALARLTPAEREAASRQLGQRLRALPVWQTARAVLAFYPLAREPDLRPVLEEAWAAGRQLSFPRFDPVTRAYEPCLVAGAQDLVAGQFGVREPAAYCPRFDAKRLDFTLVPGIGFSLSGDRLGRGWGYYDRLLSGVAGFKCGVAFDCQVIAELPVDPHDIRLNGILTPTRWQQF